MDDPYAIDRRGFLKTGAVAGFTLHAATQAGAFHPWGRDAKCRVLRRQALGDEDDGQDRWVRPE
jgi:hypothetical protein